MSKTRLGQGGARARWAARRHGLLPALSTGAHPLRALLRSPLARPLRFALTGGLAGLLQLGLLALLLGRGWPAVPANALAFLLAAQVNFALSSLFTWRDRRRTAPLWRRWLAFHGAIAAMALVNQGVFLAARTALPTLVASAAGIAVAAVGNYLLGDRLVFRARGAVAWDGRGAVRQTREDHAAVRARPARACPRGPAGARRGTMGGLGVPGQPIGPAARGPPVRKGRCSVLAGSPTGRSGALAARRGRPMDKRTTRRRREDVERRIEHRQALRGKDKTMKMKSRMPMKRSRAAIVVAGSLVAGAAFAATYARSVAVPAAPRLRDGRDRDDGDRDGHGAAWWPWRPPWPVRPRGRPHRKEGERHHDHGHGLGRRDGHRAGEPPTASTKAGTAASLADIHAGSVIAVQGSSSSTSAPTIDATSITTLLPTEVGMVTNVSGNTLTLTTLDGATHTVMVSARTHYQKAGQSAPRGDIRSRTAITVRVVESTLRSDGKTPRAQRVLIAPRRAHNWAQVRQGA